MKRLASGRWREGRGVRSGQIAAPLPGSRPGPLFIYSVSHETWALKALKNNALFNGPPPLYQPAMTVLTLLKHDLVHVRATVIEVYDTSCLLGLPINRKSQNGQHRMVLPFTEIVKRDSSVFAWEAIRLAVQLQQRAHDALLRAQAEMYEVGCHPVVAPLVAPVKTPLMPMPIVAPILASETTDTKD